MSFLDLVPADKPRRFLTVDWSESERKFKENHPRFLAMIKSVNQQIPSLNQIPEENSEKSESIQVPVLSGFSLEVEGKKEEEKRDQAEEFVEYQRAEKPNEGNATPTEGKQMDIVDEILLGETKPAETSPNIISLDIPKSQNLNHPDELKQPPDDLFSSPTPVPPVFPTSSDEQRVESKTESSVPPAPVSSIPVPATGNDSPLSSEEFNFEKFNKVKVHIVRIMQEVDESKVDSWLDTVSGYSMNLTLDEQRVRPEILADTLVKVQSNKDTVHSILLEVVKFVRWMKEAEEFIKTSGSSCSKAGSDSKRMGDVRLVMPEFFYLLAKTEATYDLYERTYKHLCNQADTVSRLVTTQANEMRYKDIFTGRIEGEKSRQTPFDGPYKRMPESNPDTIPESKLPERNTEGLDVFNKPIPKKDGKTTGIVDFEF